MVSLKSLLALGAGLVAFTSAHNIQMKAHSRECFHENLHKDDQMTVTYQVGDREFGGSGNLEIDFWVIPNPSHPSSPPYSPPSQSNIPAPTTTTTTTTKQKTKQKG